MRDPDTLDEISKERFEGTVLKAISRNMKIKQEPTEEQGAPKNGQMPVTQVEEEIPFCPETFIILILLVSLRSKLKWRKPKKMRRKKVPRRRNRWR